MLDTTAEPIRLFHGDMVEFRYIDANDMVEFRKTLTTRSQALFDAEPDLLDTVNIFMNSPSFLTFIEEYYEATTLRKADAKSSSSFLAYAWGIARSLVTFLSDMTAPAAAAMLVSMNPDLTLRAISVEFCQFLAQSYRTDQLQIQSVLVSNLIIQFTYELYPTVPNRGAIEMIRALRLSETLTATVLPCVLDYFSRFTAQVH